jgi:hypothetical protein
MAHASAWQSTDDSQTPLRDAQECFERQRDDEHRRRIRLVWSDDKEERSPSSFEVVFMDVDYGGDSFLLLQLSNGVAKVSIAKSEKYLDSVSYFTANTTTEEPMHEVKFQWLTRTDVEDLEAKLSDLESRDR